MSLIVLNKITTISDIKLDKYIYSITHFMFSAFLSKIVPFLDNVERYCIAGQAIDDNIACARCMLDT
jgi:hypothetical protein